MSPDHDAAGHIKDNADERREDDGLDGDHALSRLGYRVASRPAAARAPTRAWILGAGAEADQRRGAERFRSSSILVSMYFSRRRKSSLTRLTNVLCLSSRLFNPAAFDATDQTAAQPTSARRQQRARRFRWSSRASLVGVSAVLGVRAQLSAASPRARHVCRQRSLLGCRC